MQQNGRWTDQSKLMAAPPIPFRTLYIYEESPAAAVLVLGVSDDLQSFRH